MHRHFFLSSVNHRLHKIREQIADDLISAGYDVIERRYFSQKGGTSLEKLYSYLKKATSIIQIIGLEPGSPVSRIELNDFLENHKDFLNSDAHGRERHQLIHNEFAREECPSYTQMELYFAIHLGRERFLYRDGKLAKNSGSSNSQERVLAILDHLGADVTPYKSINDLPRRILRTLFHLSHEKRRFQRRPRIDLSHLPMTKGRLFGRENELNEISRHFDSGDVALMGISGFAGTGKTCLINHWIHDLTSSGKTTVRNVYAWSFSGQSTQGGLGSTELFFERLWEYFQFSSQPPMSLEAKAQQLAARASEEDAIIILDGVETLMVQDVRGVPVEFRERAMAVFLSNLEPRQNSLCLLTSRFSFSALPPLASSYCRELKLKVLSDDAAVALLKFQRATGSSNELLRMARRFKGHGLSLVLMAHFLTTGHDGNVLHHLKLRSLMLEEDFGATVRLMMETYDSVYNGREKDVLRLMGFFLGAASSRRIHALAGQVPGTVLSSDAKSATEVQWRYSLSRLETAGIIHRDGSDNYDCHAMVRQFYREMLEVRHPEEWRSTNEFLSEMAQGEAPENPANLEGLQPVADAVTYLARAGNVSAAYEKMAEGVIWRGDTFFVTDHLGAYGWNLTLLNEFFSSPWISLKDGFTSDAQRAMLLNEAGFSLMALAHFEEAIEPFLHSIEISRRIHDHTACGRTASNLHHVYLALGRLPDAARLCEESIHHADKGNVTFRRVASRNDLAFVRMKLGDKESAMRLIEEAWDLHPTIERLPGHYLRMTYCRLMVLLDAGETARVESELERNVEFLKQHAPPLTHALARSVKVENALARSATDPVLPPRANIPPDFVDEMEALFTTSGLIHFTPLGAITKARYLTGRSEFDEANTILQAAASMCKEAGMWLHLIDSNIELARIALLRRNVPVAKELLQALKPMVMECQYLQRMAEIEKLTLEVESMQRQPAS